MFKRKRVVRPKRYRRGGQSTTLVNTSLRPVPSRFITKHKYAEAVTVSVAGCAKYLYNLNGMWDPNRTGIGGQPYGYDQLAQLYQRYRVIACKYVVSAVSGDGANIAVAALPSNEALTALIGTVSEARMHPRAKYITQNTGGTLKMLKGNVYLPSLVGRSKAQYMSDERYQAINTANPTELAVLNLFGQGINDDPLFNANITFNILLEYTVEWFDVISQDAS